MKALDDESFRLSQLKNSFYVEWKVMHNFSEIFCQKRQVTSISIFEPVDASFGTRNQMCIII